MRIVQTFWSGNKKNLLQQNFGWYDSKSHLISWSLSCLKLKEFYTEIILYTDSEGYDLLINKLRLPYSKIYVNLDILKKYNPKLWPLSKLYTYSQQKEPFIHVDGDVFIWNSFPSNFEEKPLIAQNLEYGTGEVYESMILEIEDKLRFVPKEIERVRKKERSIHAYNAGIFGGTNTNFFNDYAKRAFEFVDKNKDNLPTLSNLTLFATLVEQYLFYCMAQYQKEKISTLLMDTIPDNGYKGFGDFEKVPFEKFYIHLIGPYKRDKQRCELMGRILLKEYPEYFLRVINFFPKDYENTIRWLETSCKKNSSIPVNNGKEGKQEEEMAFFFSRTIFFLKFNRQFEYNLFPKSRFNFDFLKTLIFKSNNPQLIDLWSLETSIWKFSKKISGNSQQDLYELFHKSDEIFEILQRREIEGNEVSEIKVNPLAKIFKTKWNWLLLDKERNQFNRNTLNTIYASRAGEYYNLITPSLKRPYYCEIQIDEFDYLIFDSLLKSKTISALEEIIRSYFTEVSDYNENDFKKLLRLRIEKLTYCRAIVIS